jgi:hypothetical protein
MKEKPLVLILIGMLICISVVSALSITVDETTETSIVWNLSQLSGVTISAIAFDGIAISGYNANASRVVQNNLYPSESHIITVVDSTGTIYENETYTLPSAQTRMVEQWNTWSYLVFIIALVFIGLMRKLGFVEVVASCVSLYALALYVQENPVLATLDIWHIQFLLYIFFFIFPYVLLYFKGGLLK